MTGDASITKPPSPHPTRNRAWLLLLCLPVGVVGALILYLGLVDLTAPRWLAVVVAASFFPVLPVVWHMLAEKTRQPLPAIPGRPLERFALRTLAIGLLVLAVSLATLGPMNVRRDFNRVVRHQPPGRPAEVAATPPPAPPVVPPPKPKPRHELEPFIPADASLVMALSDPAAMKRIFAVVGADTKKKISALEKCQIHLEGARVLIAVRDRKTRMVVIRAPGVTDQRNLYCVVGFLGSDKLGLRFIRDKDPVRFEVDGLFPKTLKFEAVDAQTIVAADATWSETLGQKLFGDPAAPKGSLASAIERVDRSASFWSAGVAHTDQGSWDLALEARFHGPDFELTMSSTPPSGAAHRAEVQVRVPPEFVAALPEGALDDGIRGLLGVIATAGAGTKAPARGQGSPARPPTQP